MATVKNRTGDDEHVHGNPNKLENAPMGKLQYIGFYFRKAIRPHFFILSMWV